MRNIGLFEAIETCAARRYLKSDPVSDADIYRILRAATCAASSRNSQPWRFIVIRDQEIKQRIGDLYRKGCADIYDPESKRSSNLDEAQQRLRRAVLHLADHIEEAPVLILVCLEWPDWKKDQAAGSGASSIWTAVQLLMLAARALGLGTVPTARHKAYEAEVKAVLGIPEHVETFALIPVGYPQRDFTVVRRKPVEEVAYRDTWGKRWEATS